MYLSYNPGLPAECQRDIRDDKAAVQALLQGMARHAFERAREARQRLVGQAWQALSAHAQLVPPEKQMTRRHRLALGLARVLMTDEALDELQRHEDFPRDRLEFVRRGLREGESPAQIEWDRAATDPAVTNLALKAEVEALSLLVTDFESVEGEQDKKIALLYRDLDERDAKNREQEKELDEHKARIRELEKTLEAREARIRELEQGNARGSGV